MGTNCCISNYQFQSFLGQIVPNLDSNKTKRFLSDLTDPDYKMISVDKFTSIYDEMRETFNE
jgi:hypothetical protein